MGIANRDIKLENILLVNERNKPVLKLCDFGYSKDEYLESCCKTMCGESQRRAALAWLGCCRTCVLGIGLLSEGYWRWIRCCKIMCSWLWWQSARLSAVSGVVPNGPPG